MRAGFFFRVSGFFSFLVLVFVWFLLGRWGTNFGVLQTLVRYKDAAAYLPVFG